MEFVMDDILIYTIIIGFAFWLGWHVRAIVIMANLASNPDKVIKMLEKIKEINEQEETWTARRCNRSINRASKRFDLCL